MFYKNGYPVYSCAMHEKMIYHHPAQLTELIDDSIEDGNRPTINGSTLLIPEGWTEENGIFFWLREIKKLDKLNLNHLHVDNLRIIDTMKVGVGLKAMVTTSQQRHHKRILSDGQYFRLKKHGFVAHGRQAVREGIKAFTADVTKEWGRRAKPIQNPSKLVDEDVDGQGKAISQTECKAEADDRCLSAWPSTECQPISQSNCKTEVGDEHRSIRQSTSFQPISQAECKVEWEDESCQSSSSPADYESISTADCKVETSDHCISRTYLGTVNQYLHPISHFDCQTGETSRYDGLEHDDGIVVMSIEFDEW